MIFKVIKIINTYGISIDLISLLNCIGDSVCSRHIPEFSIGMILSILLVCSYKPLITGVETVLCPSCISIYSVSRLKKQKLVEN